MQANSVLRKIKVKVSKLVIIFSPANIQTSPQKAAKRKLSEEADGDQNAETLGETSSKKLCSEDENTEKDQNNCVYQKLLGSVQKKSGCTYWKNGWRAKLCVCQKCKVWHGCLKRFRWCTFNGWDSACDWYSIPAICCPLIIVLFLSHYGKNYPSLFVPNSVCSFGVQGRCQFSSQILFYKNKNRNKRAQATFL